MRQRRIRKWSDEQLREAVKNSTNLTDVLRALGLRVAGGNHASIKYWIDEFGLDISHFCTDSNLESLRIARLKNTLNREEVLCENSKASKNTLKKWARKELDYKCVKCYNVGFHNGLPLTLQLDHINGVPNDNRIENLRWLCPNCHSQSRPCEDLRRKNKTNPGSSNGRTEDLSQTRAIE